MTNLAHTTDGHLPAARKQLADAIHALAGRTTGTLNTDTGPRIAWGDSLYMQLTDMIAGAQGTQLGNSARSMPPLWIDAADLLHHIDRTVRAWQPDPGIYDGDLSHEPTPETVRRLHLIEDRAWRPQDVDHITGMANQIQAWAAQTATLLDPPPAKTLPNPCPSCGATVVYRRDSAGETVRQPALQISTDACRCLNCTTMWPADQFVFLARVLGYDTLTEPS